MAKTLKVITPAGMLRVEKSIDSDFPGFYVTLDGAFVAAVEYDSTRNKHRVHVWGKSPKPQEYDCAHDPVASVDIDICPLCQAEDTKEPPS